MSTKYHVKDINGNTLLTRSSKKAAINGYLSEHGSAWVETDKGTLVCGQKPAQDTYEGEAEKRQAEAEAEGMDEGSSEAPEATSSEPVSIPMDSDEDASEEPEAPAARRCNFCGEDKPLDKFYRHKSRCKACYKEYADAYHEARKARRAAAAKLEAEVREEMMAEAN